MPIEITTQPADEPVTLAEAKAHCRVDTSADDAIMSSLIKTARLHIEAGLGLALVTQSWRLTRSAWPALGMLRLPVRPVRSVKTVAVRATTGALAAVDPALWWLDIEDDGRGALRPRSGQSWPNPSGSDPGGIVIDIEAGYGGPDDVPRPIRQALLQLTAHWYEHRLPELTGQVPAPPVEVSRLLAPYRPFAL